MLKVEQSKQVEEIVDDEEFKQVEREEHLEVEGLEDIKTTSVKEDSMVKKEEDDELVSKSDKEKGKDGLDLQIQIGLPRYENIMLTLVFHKVVNGFFSFLQVEAYAYDEETNGNKSF